MDQQSIEKHAAMNSAQRRFRGGSVRVQHGQALVMSIIVLLVLCLGLVMLFDTGQVVTKKVQLTNAADAAAYSVAIEQARALNTAAYLNRAEVANQVAIAQIVTLQSYGIYTDSTAGRWSRYLSYLEWIPYIGEVAAEISQTLQEIKQTIAEVLPETDKAGTFAVSALNELNDIYSQAQAHIFQVFAVQSGVSTVRDVVKANTLDANGQSTATIPDLGVALLGAQLAQFAGVGSSNPVTGGNLGYTTRYQIPQAANGLVGAPRSWAGDRDADVMMAARDGFSASRNASFGPFTKAGATDLVDYNRWVAVDTAKFDLNLFLFDIEFTTGMGAAAALPNSSNYNSSAIISPGIRLTMGSGTGPTNYRPGHGTGWDSPYTSGYHEDPYNGALNNVGDVAGDPTDRSYTQTSPQQVSWMPSSHSGLQDYNDVSPNKAVEPYDTSSSDKSDVGPVFTVFVQQPSNSVRTSSTLNMTTGDMKLNDQGVGSAISAVSSAQVYYSRPQTLFPRPDDKRELGSLFEPYWQVRLIDTPTDYKVALGLLTGVFGG
jgi:hypothetical protein